MLLHSLLFTTFFSCSKKDFQESSQSEKSVQATAATSITVNPSLMYEESFEGSVYFPLSGDLIDKTHSIENCGLDWTLSTATNPAFKDMKASRFELRKDMPLVGTAQRHRSEVVIIKGTEDSRFTPDIWYSFAVLFPTVGMETDLLSRDIINQWFEDANSDNTIKVDKGKVYFEATPNLNSTTKLRFDLFSQTITKAQSNTVSDMVAIPKDQWNEFTFHFIHSFTDGLVDIYRNGVLIHHITGRTMHYQYPKWKMGLYKADMDISQQYSRAIYFDNIRVGKKGSTITDMISTTTPPPPPPANVPPVAHAGSDITITLPVNSVALSGSASDSDGTIVSTMWTKISGPADFIFSAQNILKPTVSNLTAGVYTFRLTVTDDKGATATDDVNVTVKDAPPAASINSFTLVNASTEKDLTTITDGGTYSLKQLGTGKLNIRANPGSTLSNVKFELSGTQTMTYIDSAVPYALMGDNGKGNYYYGNWNPPALGSYTLKAIPYVSGVAGTPTTIHFTFVQ